jgi:general secretion pathway protein G
MVAVLVILSILAAIAAPYAKKGFRREKEIQLRETLRTVRTAIDRFHTDWEAKQKKQGAGAANANVPGAASTADKSASANGYPHSLQVLVDGVEKPDRQRKKYLRSLPVNPFAPPGTPFEAQWSFVSSQSETAQIQQF